MQKRIFAAIELSDEARSSISSYIESLRARFPNVRAGWADKQKLHLTLKFFGEIDTAMIDPLKTAADNAAAAAGPFRLKISGAGVFPNRQKPRILWLGLTDESLSLKKVFESFESECEKDGFLREKRIFKPHLTICRLREPKNEMELVRTHLMNKFEPVVSVASAITLIESSLLPTGSVYRLVHRSGFGK